MSTYWQATDRGDPLTLILELIDAQGNVWTRREDVLWEYYPRDQWPRDQLIEWQSTLLLPIGLPPGQYQLRLRVAQPDSGAVLAFDRATPDGNLSLGTIDVAVILNALRLRFVTLD